MLSNKPSLISKQLSKPRKTSRKPPKRNAKSSKRIWTSSRTIKMARLTSSRFVGAQRHSGMLVDIVHRQADISKQKAALQKHAVVVKTQQKEVQTAALELGRSVR